MSIVSEYTATDVLCAPLSQFRSTTPHVLFGQKLLDVKVMAGSIKRHGLLSPLLVSRHNGRLIVIDGRTRLAALRRLRFQKSLPRGLDNIPYIMHAASAQKAPSLLSSRELYTRITALKSRGHTAAEIAQTLYLPVQTVTDVLAATRLSPKLKQAYFNGHINLAQAKAFVALPHHGAQDRFLQILGPYTAARDIIAAINAGDTVINLGDDNVVIMPSASPSRRAPITPNYQTAA